MPDQSIIEMLRQSLRGLLTPRDAPSSPTAIGPLNAIDLPAVPSPYPFRNPITPTKELDAAMRNIRSISPGAGTTTREITQTPPRKLLASAMYDSIDEPNPTPILFPGDTSQKGTVYINPRTDNQGAALAGQLARVATPSAQQQLQDSADRNLKIERTRGSIGGPQHQSYAIKGEDRQHTAEEQYASLLAALQTAFVGARK